MFKVSEVYEKKYKSREERPDGTEYVTYLTKYATRESLINKDYIVAVHPHEFSSPLIEEKVCQSFPYGTKFCTLVVDGNSFRKSELLIVGSFEKLCGLLGG